MSRHLLSDPAAADPSISSLWRNYWNTTLDRTPDWPNLRLRSFMSAEEGRRTEYIPSAGLSRRKTENLVIQTPVVRDFPDGKGMFIGVLPRPAASAGIIQFEEPGHLLTVAPTRTGKGTSHIIPNMLTYSGSAVVVDIKGEIYDITADYRRRMFPGSRVLRFAPFEEETACYNPLDFVRSEDEGGHLPETIEDARLLAEMLVPGKSSEPFWDMESRNVATMLIAFVASSNPTNSSDRTMREVSRLLFRNEGPDKDDKFNLTIREIIEFARKDDFKALEALAVGFDDHEERLRDNILSSCRTDLLIWSTERLQEVTSHSDFKFEGLKESMCRPVSQRPGPTTLYIVIPPEYLKMYQPLVRLMIGLAVTEMTRELPWAKVDGYRPKPPCPVLFLLDELPALGYMQPIVNGLTYLAAYDVRLWTFAQNLGQLREIYRDAWHNFPANSAVTCFFGVNDLETAEFVSRQLGQSEEEAESYGTTSKTAGDSRTFGFSMNSSGSSTQSSSTTSQEHQRFRREHLASASDVRATHKDLQYVFMRNRRPILATKLDYYRFPLFDELYGHWRNLGEDSA